MVLCSGLLYCYVGPVRGVHRDWIMDTASIKVMTRDLPNLDLADFLAGVDGAADSLSLEIRDVYENVCFFFIRNHGISEDLIERIFAEAKRFHDLPDDQKLALRIDQNQRGYIPPTIKTPSWIATPPWFS